MYSVGLEKYKLFNFFFFYCSSLAFPQHSVRNLKMHPVIILSLHLYTDCMSLVGKRVYGTFFC